MSNLQEIADLENTVQVSARRFEESPYIARTGSPEMVRGVYAGRYLAIHNKEDPIEKYWQLRRKALIFDVPEKPVEINGPDAVPFLTKYSPAKSQLCTRAGAIMQLPAPHRAVFLWTA